MLTRRHLRIKVMQAVYAHQSVGEETIGEGEKKMLKSFGQLHDLFVYQLSFLVEIFDFAEQKIEEGKNKLLPSREDLEPNTRFIDNRLIKKIRENRDYINNYNRLRINWKEHTDVVRKAYNTIRESELYKKYMEGDRDSFQEDRKLLINLIKEFISDFQPLKQIYEEKSIFWDEDYYAASMMLLNAVEAVMPSDDEFVKLPAVFKDIDERGRSEDRQFAVDLFRKTVISGNKYDEVIAARARNWEFERIARVDVILLKMAITELLEFPSIPVKVTLNEYIEISKYYSTPKSRIFINGILDTLIAEMNAEGKIKKTGRGLIDN
ncbi:MAG: transcription antitermination factor NusB [Bacteroidota bacterium]